MKDKSNIPLNDLNIPPENENSSRLDWMNLLHLLTPIALGFVYYKGKQEKNELQEKLNKKVQSEENFKSAFPLHEFFISGNETLQRDIERLEVEEEHKAQLTLQKLSGVEEAIKQILDIWCSPFRLRDEREKIQRELLHVSQEEEYKYLNMQEGLNHIFQYDDVHCGGGYHQNGQLYRVWVKLWKKEVENNKQHRIALRKAELLKEKMYNKRF